MVFYYLIFVTLCASAPIFAAEKRNDAALNKIDNLLFNAYLKNAVKNNCIVTCGCGYKLLQRVEQGVHVITVLTIVNREQITDEIPKTLIMMFEKSKKSSQTTICSTFAWNILTGNIDYSSTDSEIVARTQLNKQQLDGLSDAKKE